MDNTKAGNVAGLLVWILQSIPESVSKKIMDNLLDMVEDALADKPHALRLINLARQILDIPDDWANDAD